MPIISSSYSPSYLFRNGHISTIYPNLFRKVSGVIQQRERIELKDRDFIDLDWSYSTVQASKLCILIHGLEGNGQRQYITGLAKYLNQNNWDTVAINLRNCSGEPNRKYRSYYAGVSEDLDFIINYISSSYAYSSLSICGFSLGGNVLLKYLGEGREIPSQVCSGVAISTPCNLYDSLLQLNKPENVLYRIRFLRHLKKKLLEKQILFPDKIRISDIKKCKNLIDIDNLYTSVAHGYTNALDYYQKCSSKQFLPSIKIPSLIINAKNDTFLGADCYPYTEASQNKNVFLETPDFGGHVGYYLPNHVFYNEIRTFEFIEEHL
ncbi:YheT family hydrolase [Aquimarina hainanensis]|uniref:YheT family hydrolase n=1 Tax=Aquimarina hainanensis TaxID=1578017 RepID=A0ABW5N7F6_9FLAO|nr:alpha/beta fold hydrolase [Aquimarina sp. TRL1]QKX04900.1 alpha/beta fold hydrolase [Aquimarina sp. TRL1]